MKRLFFIGLAVLLAQNLIAQTKVFFSQQGGFYEESFPLEISCAEGFHVRYTVNGSIPTADDILYTGPLFLDEALYSHSNIYTIVNCIPSVFFSVDDVERIIVVRAAAFDENDNRVGEVATNSYMIRSLGCDIQGLPMMSICADSLDLFDYETGIFVPGVYYDASDSTHTGNFHQTGREWERRINVEFYEPDNTGINQQCGLRIHGGASRWFQQKGMKLYAREEYGKKRFKHKLFDSVSISSFKRLVLHPFRCSNWLQTGGQDYLSQCVAAQMDIDALGVREVVVFINGEYWGIYTLEESPDERYLEDHYDIDLDQVNIIKYWGVTNYGDGMDWWRFRNWIGDADLNQPEDSAYAFSRMDVPSFIDYFLLETYSANLDWPQNNVLLWQASNGEPFRMLFFDGDGCFTRWYYDALDNAMHSGGNSFVINKFLECCSFVKILYDRYIELKFSTFRYDNMMQIWDDYRQQVESEVPQQSERFGFPRSVQRWQSDMDSTQAFFSNRVSVFDHELWDVLYIGDNMHDGIVVYPNPSSGAFSVVLHDIAAMDLPVEIYNGQGRLVVLKERALQCGDNTLYLQVDLPSGLYLVKIGTSVKQIVIQ